MVKKNSQKIKLKKNNVYSNFKLISREKYKEIDSVINIFKHQKLGTELFFIENNDKKRAFEVSFRTPSINDSGIQHIIEHSVLRGSRKYDFGNKETFALLIQNSMVSFLNAVTYPDKTLYPFSTNIESEFFKIMDIYLDAVYFPNLTKNKNFFKQEGWRYDKDENGDIFYNGVVFNEMKGFFGSIERVRDDEISKSIFKDTQESLSSGGDPNEIPNLKWEDLVEYHQKYYHPTNSTIYVYGDLDILKVLSEVENEFLSNFPKKGKKSEKIKVQKKFSGVEKTVKISSSKINKADDFSISFLIDTINKIEKKDILSFLMLFLVKSESSILKTKMRESKYLDNFDGYLEDEYNQFYLNFVFEGINSKDKKKIEKEFYEALEKISIDGIDRKTLKSFLSSFEYQEAVKKYNREKGLGIIDAINKYNNYDFPYKHIFDRKNKIKVLKDIVSKKVGEKGSLEEYIKKYLLKNKSKVSLIIKATKNYNKYSVLDKKLQKINKNKKSKIYKDIEKEISEFKEYEKSSFTNISKILPPKKSEIPKKPIKNKFHTKIIKDKKDDFEVKYYFSEILEKNIKKVSLVFNAATIDEGEIQKYKFLVDTIGFFTVDGKTKQEFEKERNTVFGNFSISNMFLTNIDTEKINIKFIINMGYLIRNEKRVFSFLNNFFDKIIFDEKTISERLDILIKAYYDAVAADTISFALKRAGSKVNKIGSISEKTSGIEYLKFLETTREEFKKDPEKIVKDLENIFQKITLVNNLKIAIAGSKKDFSFHKNLELGIKDINGGRYSHVFKKENEAIIVDTLTNAFNISNAKIKRNFEKNIEKYVTLRSILNYDFLWRKVREDGGAYGSGVMTSILSKSVSLYSYMDSRIDGTYNDFKLVPEYLKSKELQNSIDEEKMRGIWASTLGDFLEQDFAINIAYSELMDELSGYNYKRKTSILKNILSMTSKDFYKIGKDFEKIFKDDVKVTIASREKIEKDKKIFDSIWELK